MSDQYFLVNCLVSQGGEVATAKYSYDGFRKKFTVLLEGLGNEEVVVSPEFDKMSEARTFAEDVVGTSQGRPAQAEVDFGILKMHKDKGANLLVTIDRANGKYAICAGYPPYRWVDTELRFASQSDAKKALEAIL